MTGPGGGPGTNALAMDFLRRPDGFPALVGLADQALPVLLPLFLDLSVVVQVGLSFTIENAAGSISAL